MTGIGDHIKKLGFGRGSRDGLDTLDDDIVRPKRNDSDDSLSKDPGISETSSSMIRALIGPITMIEDFYFPTELIGGTCPRIAGDEEEIVWNAAAEACDTERVHVVWQSFENRIWYLAVKSSELASHPRSWCPLAALMPTMKDASTMPVCYTYFGEEIAVLMIVTPDGLQVFRGTNPIVRAKAERTARELGNAPIVNIDQDRIEQMTPVPWYSMSLFEDRARRVLATVSIIVSLGITAFSFLVFLSANMSLLASRRDISDALQHTQTRSLQMMRDVEATRTSPMRDQIEKFLNVNDTLLGLNGYLSIYEIKQGQTRWRATVPPSATADKITAIGGKNIESNDRGSIIGNDAELEFEKSGVKR